MSSDPIQALIAAGAFPANPFGTNSRYRDIALGLHVRGTGDTGIPYVLRRFIPQRRDIPIAFEHIVHGGERPDTLAGRAFGDAELYWRLADANAVTDPFELTDTIGARIGIPAVSGA